MVSIIYLPVDKKIDIINIKLFKYVCDSLALAINLNFNGFWVFSESIKLKFIILFKFLKIHLGYNYLIDIFGTDLSVLPLSYKFAVHYILSNVNMYSRISLKLKLFSPICESISALFKGALWAEREIWDLFGIYFFNHSDLKRILTDYGFKGHPLCKSFPLTGYLELRYDESSKRLVYEPVTITQELRIFNFTKVWGDIRNNKI